MIEQIISGGQSGADQGALVGARQCGIKTGGWMPRGYRTEFGPAPSLAKLYNLKEHPSVDYPPRTRQNVRDSDGTIWVGKANSRGYECTLNATFLFHKPFLVDPTPEELQEWVTLYQINVLNVAGPRASRDRHAFERAAKLIIAAFSKEEHG